jgi:hypothetical protein
MFICTARRVAIQRQASSPTLLPVGGIPQRFTATPATNESPVLSHHVQLSSATPATVALADSHTVVTTLGDTHSPFSQTPCPFSLDESEFVIPTSVEKPPFSRYGLSLRRGWYVAVVE